MKRLATLLLCLLAVFTMAGCTPDYMEDRLLALEEQVANLQEENVVLQTEKETLLAEKTLLEEAKTTLEANTETLTTEKNTLTTQITQLEADLETAKSDDRVVLEQEIATLEAELQEVTSALESSFDGAFILKLGSDIHLFNFIDDEKLSLFEVIDNSNITLNYVDTEYGHMVTGIGSLEADLFNWITILVNGESSFYGVDDLVYNTGDVIEFQELTKTWESTFTATYEGDGGFSNLMFTAESGEQFFIHQDNLPSGYTVDSFIENTDYVITGLSEIGLQGYGCSNCIVPSAIETSYVDDFTELYNLDSGTEVMLKFTVTELSVGWVWGNEVKASDVNGLLSKDITSNLKDPYSSGYLFYTFPSDVVLEVGKTYLAKLTFDLFPPNSKAQLGFMGTDIDGNVDYNNVEIYELDDNDNIVKSAIVNDTPTETTTCSGFMYVKDSMTTGDQCEITFTVTSFSWGTPQATDALGVPSTEVMGYLFDPSWGATVVDATYTVTIEKQSNGQIKLVGDLTEATNE